MYAKPIIAGRLYAVTFRGLTRTIIAPNGAGAIASMLGMI